MSQHDLEHTGRNVRSGVTTVHPPGRARIIGIHDEATKIANGGGDDPMEYVVSVEVSDVLIVRADSAEEAIAKVMLSTQPRTDTDIETVSHDVHTCVHTGDDAEECGGCEHEGDDKE